MVNEFVFADLSIKTARSTIKFHIIAAARGEERCIQNDEIYINDESIAKKYTDLTR